MLDKIIDWCKQHHVSWKFFTQYQTRLYVGEKAVCDIYHTNGRYHIIRHPNKEMVQQRGNIPKEFELFLESLFLNIH